MTISPTSYPTQAPTMNSTNNGTIIPIKSNNDIGTEIGVGVIVGIIMGSLAALGIIFQKLICFKIFDSYGNTQSIFTDICSCYREEWQKTRDFNNEDSQNPQPDLKKPTDKNDKSTDDKNDKKIDTSGMNNHDGGDSTTAAVIVSTSDTADIELGNLASTAMSTALNNNNGQISLEFSGNNTLLTLDH